MVKDNPHQPQPYVKLQHPAWTRDAVIYQINTRQFTPQGTFRAAAGHLDRLQDLGVDILWLMPIHPIGKKNRKGVLGSPYAVQDYYGVNPEFGSLGDLKFFLDGAHRRGMKVILDWVANHTAWDHVLVSEHPEWYSRDWQGNFRPTPWLDWEDIIELDYSHQGLRRYMTAAMKYWVEEGGVDGFRCDVAGFVPTDFWAAVRRELEKVKPIFLLAEWESRDLHAEAFDASYAWTWYDALQRITSGQAGLAELYSYYAWNSKAYPADALRMTFVSNHDKNAWEGTQFQQFGDGLEAAIVLSVVGEGIPLIYNGQEAGNPRRLAFFERDPIAWREHPIGALYRRLINIKKAHSALWNGGWGARMIPVKTSQPDQVFSFVRQDARGKVFCLLNFSSQEKEVVLLDGPFEGEYRDAFSGEKLLLAEQSRWKLSPRGVRLLLSQHS